MYRAQGLPLVSDNGQKFVHLFVFKTRASSGISKPESRLRICLFDQGDEFLNRIQTGHLHRDINSRGSLSFCHTGFGLQASLRVILLVTGSCERDT